MLVVDDDDGVREAVTWALEADGFEVVAVDNGLAAMDALTTASPVLAVLDLSLPGLGGLDILRRLRADEAREGRRSLPVIVLSGRDSESPNNRNSGQGPSKPWPTSPNGDTSAG